MAGEAGKGGKGWALRVKVSPALPWLYHLPEFDLIVQPDATVHKILNMMSIPAEAVVIKVNGQRSDLSRSMNDGDEVEIAPRDTSAR